jgi:hypothetical protein
MAKAPDPNTPSPAALRALMETYEQLKKVRASKTVTLKPCSMLRTEIVGMDGLPQPFRLRYYQVQGIYHLMTMKRMVLGDGTGLGKCVTENTLLVTDQGLLPIWEIAPEGELKDDTFYEPRIPVKVRTGNTYNDCDMAEVRRFYWCGQKETRKVTTRNGFRVEGSLVHPVLVRGPEQTNPAVMVFEAMKKLPELQVGQDYICIDRGGDCFPTVEPAIPFDHDPAHANAKMYNFPAELTPDLARLLGYVVAEAWTNGRYNVNISQHKDVNPDAHEDIRGLLATIFGWAGDAGNAERDKLISVTSIRIRKYLEACGVNYVTSHDKEVPWSVLRASRLSVRGFLRGLFEGEASVVEGGVEFSSSSEKLARGTQLLLLRFGIVSTLSPKRVKGFEHTYWRLTFFGEDAQIFDREIGFASERKRAALRAGLTGEPNPNKDVVPYMGLPVAALKEALLEATAKTGSNDERKGSGLKQYGESFQSTLKHVIHGHRNPTYRFLRQLLEIGSVHGLQNHTAFLEIQSVVRQHYFYDPVVQVEEGFAPLMDVEVHHPSHRFSGNGFVNHNTIEVIGALCYLWSSKEANNKVIIVTPKSALRQWAAEVLRFTHGVKPFVVSGDLSQRRSIYEAWLGHEGPALLILNYALLIRDWDQGAVLPTKPNGQPDPKGMATPGLLDRLTAAIPKLVTVFDEATAFKNTATKTWQTCRFLSDRSHRCYALTATLLKNNLMEGFSIYKVVYSSVFSTKTKFMDDYCVTKRQLVRGGRQIPIVVGYRNLELFRMKIDPFFLGRPKHAVSDELPTLITKEIRCELSPTEDHKYSEALSGVLELGDGEVRDYEDHKAFVSLIYCQQVVNSLSLLRFKADEDIYNPASDAFVGKVGGLSAKEEALVDLLSEELDDEKVIVFTRFESHVARLQQVLTEAKIKSVRITGKEKDEERRKAQAAFQDLKSSTRVIFITAAGTEAINLQAAGAMIYFDAPWSWGDYVQGIGRMIRIGSPHQHVVVYHLIAERPSDTVTGRRTIDHYTLALLRGKKDLIDKVLGESAVGALEFEKGTSFVRNLVRNLKGRDDQLDIGAAIDFEGLP